MDLRIFRRRRMMLRKILRCISMSWMILSPLNRGHPRRNQSPRHLLVGCHHHSQEEVHGTDQIGKHIGNDGIEKRRSTRNGWKIRHSLRLWATFSCMIQGRRDRLIRLISLVRQEEGEEEEVDGGSEAVHNGKCLHEMTLRKKHSGIMPDLKNLNHNHLLSRRYTSFSLYLINRERQRVKQAPLDVRHLNIMVLPASPQNNMHPEKTLSVPKTPLNLLPDPQRIITTI